jgi:hypothetical protein
MGRPGWSWRRRGSPVSRWLATVGGPLAAVGLVALYASYPDPDLWAKLAVLLFLPITIFVMVLFEETGSVMRLNRRRRRR